MTTPHRPHRRRRAPGALLTGALLTAALAAALPGCAGGALSTAPAPEIQAPAPPEWKLGFTWKFVTRDAVLSAARTALLDCVIGQTALLDDALLTETTGGFAVIDRLSGERRMWLAVEDIPGQPGVRIMNLNWVDGVGEAARARFVRMVDQSLEGKPAC